MPLILLIAALSVILSFGVVQAKTYLTQPQAIELVLPHTKVERKTVFLTKEQLDRIEALAGTRPETRIMTYYVGRGDKGVEGVAFFDRRIVRTLPIVYTAVVKPSGLVDRVEVLSFDEPDDYFPPARWLAVFRNRPLNSDLALGRGVPKITGASLTSQSMTDGLRLILAVFQIAVKDKL